MRSTPIIAAIGPQVAPVKLFFAIVLIAAIGGAAAAEDVPLPRPRPGPDFAPFAEIARPFFDPAELTTAPSDCRLRLNETAVIEPLPRLIGPGECGGSDMVWLRAVVLADKTRIALAPPPALRCRMAEAVAAWVRDEVAPKFKAAGSSLRSIENYDSYDCRGRNRVFGAKMSEHGKGNALDVRLFKLADGKLLDPTDVNVAKDLRETLRQGACSRFMTVLGPGSDGYHERHIHLDLAERRSGYRMCRWAVLEPPPPPSPEAGLADVPLPRPRPVLPGETPRPESGED